jgi:hypothetical protein
MHQEPDDEQVSFCDLSPEDQFSFLIAEMLRLLCVDNDLTLVEARKVVARSMGGLYPHIAFDRVPVGARLQ